MVHPWLVMGDFNAMLRRADKRGGAEFSLVQNQPFIDCCHVCALSGTSFFGPKFTWHRGNTSERIDRALTNEDWRVKFPLLKPVIYQEFIQIIILSLPCARTLIGLGFPWFGHALFRPTVDAAWAGDLDLPVKLNNLTPKLKKWNKDVFGNIFRRKKLLEDRLEALELQQATTFSDDTRVEELAAQVELERVLWEEELTWIQKARSKWVIDADRNTSYYHKSTLRRRAFNRISRLKNEKGVWVEEDDTLMRMAVSFFADLYAD
ncbi:hypothetical protein LINPERHAP2_LOCUS15186 [Linum perenne]